jgi:O-antigen/teichoic acid export membrane protein
MRQKLQHYFFTNVRYVRHLGGGYLLMFVNYAIFFFLTPLMLNKLGQEQYSIWLLLSNVILFFSLSNFGLSSTFGIELPKVQNDKWETDRLLNTLLFSLLGISALSSLVFIVFNFNIDIIFKSDARYVYLIQITFLFFFLAFLVSFIGSLFDTILVATGNLATKNRIDIARVICIGISSILLVIFNQSIVSIAFSNFFFTTIFFFVTFYSCKKIIKYKVDYKMFDWRLFKKILSPSWHYFLAGIAGMIVFYSDNLLISKLKGVEFVGIYAITYRLSDVCLKIIQKISYTKYPKIIALSTTKKYPEILKLHNKLFLLNILVTAPVCLGLFFFGKDILILWLGNKHDYNNDIIRVFSIFTFFMVSSQNTGLFISGLGIHKRAAYMGMVEGGVNLALSYILFQYYDLMGIALGTLFAHLLTNGWFMYYEFFRFISIKCKSI